MEDPLPKMLAIVLIGLALAACSKIEPTVAEYATVQDSAIIAQSPHYVEEMVTLASKLDRIIFCESSGNPDAKNPRSSATGLCQFIDQTKCYVEQKWNMEIDWDNAQDQYYACKRLLEEEGDSHWNESKKCWGY